jgi:uroporphyrinogen-III synthase
MPATDGHPAQPPCHLGGLSVLVTRPEHQAEGLCDLIQAAHGRPIRFPTLVIRGPADKQAARAGLLAASKADLLIFVSANAVQYAFPLLPDQLPLDIAIAAVGQATARALSDAGLDPTLVPERMDSEGLLALPELNAVAGKSVVILRGNGGRELLAETLRDRGARVTQVEVYRRELPQRSAGARNLVDGWNRLVDVAIATSSAIFDNLVELLGEQGLARLRHTPLVVVSQRTAEHALANGCEVVFVAASASDSDLLGALCEVEETLRRP